MIMMTGSRQAQPLLRALHLHSQAVGKSRKTDPCEIPSPLIPPNPSQFTSCGGNIEMYEPMGFVLTQTNICICTDVYKYMYICIHVHTYIYSYMCIYMCVYIHVHIYVHIHTYIYECCPQRPKDNLRCHSSEAKHPGLCLCFIYCFSFLSHSFPVTLEKDSKGWR